MTTELDWVLQTIWEAWPGTFPEDLTRVDRDESKLLEGDIRKRHGDLKRSNFVGATHVGTAKEPIGTEYDYKIETTIGIRIEGLHVDQFGHVDPSGAERIPWQELTNNIERGLLSRRSYPDVGAPNRSYHTLRTANESDQSHDWADAFRRDFDLLLIGYETLP